MASFNEFVSSQGSNYRKRKYREEEDRAASFSRFARNEGKNYKKKNNYSQRVIEEAAPRVSAQDYAQSRSTMPTFSESNRAREYANQTGNRWAGGAYQKRGTMPAVSQKPNNVAYTSPNRRELAKREMDNQLLDEAVRLEGQKGKEKERKELIEKYKIARGYTTSAPNADKYRAEKAENDKRINQLGKEIDTLNTGIQTPESKETIRGKEREISTLQSRNKELDAVTSQNWGEAKLQEDMRQRRKIVREEETKAFYERTAPEYYKLSEADRNAFETIAKNEGHSPLDKAVGSFKADTKSAKELLKGRYTDEQMEAFSRFAKDKVDYEQNEKDEAERKKYSDIISKMNDEEKEMLPLLSQTFAEKGINDYYGGKREILKEEYGLTDDEITILSILQKREQNKIDKEEYDKVIKPFLKDHPWLAWAATSANIFGGAVYALGQVNEALDNAKLREAGYEGKLQSQAENNPLSAAYNLNTLNQEVNGDRLGGWYDRSNQIANNILTNVTGPVASAISFWTNGYASGVNEATANGADFAHAQALGAAQGTNEMLFEKLSWGSLGAVERFTGGAIKSAGVGKALAEWLPKIALDMGINGLEEVNTDAANDIADYLINGDFSKYALESRALLEQGYSRDEVTSMIGKEIAQNYAKTFAEGAIQGGIMAGAYKGLSEYNARKTGLNAQRYGYTPNIIENAEIAGETAKEYKDAVIKQEGGEDNLSPAQIGRIAQETQKRAVADETVRENLQKAYKEREEKRANFKQAIDNETRFAVTNAEIDIDGKKTYIDGKNKGGAEKANIFRDGKNGLEFDTGDDRTLNLTKENVVKIQNAEARELAEAVLDNNLKAESANLLFDSYDGEYTTAEHVKSFLRLYHQGALGMSAKNIETFYGTDRSKFTEEDTNRILNLGLKEKPLTVGITDFSTIKKSWLQEQQLNIIDKVVKGMSNKNPNRSKEVIVVDRLTESYIGADGKEHFRHFNGTAVGDNRILLSLTADNGLLLSFVAHEMGHQMKLENKAAFDNLAKFVKSHYTEEEYNKAIQGFVKKGYTAEEAKDELVCNSLFEVFDKNTVREIVGDDYNLAYQMLDFASELVSRINRQLDKYANKTDDKGNYTHYDLKKLREDGDFVEGVRERFLEFVNSEPGESGESETVSRSISDQTFDESARDEQIALEYWNEYTPDDVKAELAENFEILQSGILEKPLAYNGKEIRHEPKQSHVKKVVQKLVNRYGLNNRQAALTPEERQNLQSEISELYSYMMNDKDAAWDELVRRAQEIVLPYLRNTTKRNTEAKNEVLEQYSDSPLYYGFRPKLVVGKKTYEELLASHQLNEGMRSVMDIVVKDSTSYQKDSKAYRSLEDRGEELANAGYDWDSPDAVMAVYEFTKNMREEIKEAQENSPAYSNDDGSLYYATEEAALEIASDFFEVGEEFNPALKSAQRIQEAEATGDKSLIAKVKIEEKIKDLKREHKQEISDIRAQAEQQIKERNDKISELETEIGGLESQRNDLQRELNAANKLLKAENTEKSEYKAKAEQLDKKIKTIEKKLETSKEKLSELRKTTSKAVRHAAAEERRLERRNETINKNQQRSQIKRTADKIIKKLQTNGDQSSKHVPEGLKNSALEFARIINEAGAFDSKKREKLSESLTKISNALAKNNDSAEDGDSNMMSMYDEELRNAISKLAEGIGGRKLTELTSAELKEVKEIAKYVHHIIVNANKAFSAGLKESISEMGESAYGEISSKKPSKIFYYGVQTGMLKPVTFFDMLGSKTLSKLYKGIRDGELKWYRVIAEAKQFRIDTQKQYNYDKWKDQTVTVQTREGNVELPMEEALALYATITRSNNQGANHLLQGGFSTKTIKDRRMTAEDMTALIGSLTDEQRGYAEAMIEYLSRDMSALGNEITMRLYGIRKFTEEHYFPLSSDPNVLYEDGSGNLNNVDNRIKHFSMTKSLTKNANNALTIGNFTDTCMRHCSDMGLYYGLCLPMEDFNRVYNYKGSMPTEDEGGIQPNIKKAIERAFPSYQGKDNDKQTNNALSYIATLRADINGKAGRDSARDLVRRMISLSKKGAVFASASVAVQQPSAIGRAFRYINPKYFVKTTFTKRDYEECKKYCAVAGIKEMGFFDTGVGRSAADWMTQGEYATLKEKGKAIFTDSAYRDELLSKLPSVMDEITWAHIWNAVKAEIADTTELKEGTEEFYDAAAERFTYVIDRTQVYDSVFSRSEYMRSKDTGAQVMTAFMAEPTTAINMLYSAGFGTLYNGETRQQAVGKAVASFLTAVVLNSLLKSLVTTARHAGRDDDEEKSLLELYVEEFFKNGMDDAILLNYIPYVKDMWSALQGYDSERMDTTAISKLAEAYQTAVKDGFSYKSVKAIASAAGLVTGVPVANIWKDIEAATNIGKRMIKTIQGEGVKTTAEGLGYAVRDGVFTPNKKRQYNSLINAYINDNDKRADKLEQDLQRHSKSGNLSQTYVGDAVKDKLYKDKMTESEAVDALVRYYGYKDGGTAKTSPRYKAQNKVAEWLEDYRKSKE